MMSEKVKKRNKIIGISLGLLVVLIIVISSTYAYWQITAHQEDTNVLKAACLNFEVDFETGITFEDEWPLATADAMRDLTGYKFTITNNCDSEVNYEIGLESLYDSKITDYMEYEYVALAIDNYYLGTYDGLEDLTGPTANPRASKKLMTSTLGAGEVKEHILKIWIDDVAPVETQSKGFAGKLFIIGGPNIENNAIQATDDACFTMDGNEIIGYDSSCGTSVVIPASVSGVAVKTIDSNAFKNLVPEIVYYGGDIETLNQSTEKINKVSSIDTSSATLAYIFDNYEEDSKVDLNLASIIGNSTYIIKLTSDAPVNTTVDGAAQQYNIAEKVKNYNEIPELEVGQVMIYANLDANFSGDTLGARYYKENSATVAIKGLDLSQAYNLEKVEEYAFTNVPKGITDLSDLENYAISLTSLNFGNNANVEIGQNAFSRIDVPELTLYASMIPSEINFEGSMYTGYFGASEIDKLVIKPGSSNVLSTKKQTINNEEVILSLVSAIKADEMVIESGIKEISDYYFSGIKGNVYYTGSKLTLSNDLIKIGNSAFYNSPFDNVTIGSGITSIGENAFHGMASTQTITINKADSTGMTLGTGWSGNATLVYSK